MVVLAGCRLDVDVATAVDLDGSGTVTVTVRADAELLAAVPGVLADLRLDDAEAAGWTVGRPTVAADGSATASLAKPFATPAQATQVLAEVSGPDGPLRALTVDQDRDFALVTTSVDGQLGVTGLPSFADAPLVAALGAVPLADRVRPEQLAGNVGLVVRFRLPGAIVAADPSAVVAEDTVTWQAALTPGAITPVQARAEARDEGAADARDRATWLHRAFWLWVALVAVVALVGGLWWWRRRRRRRAPA